MKSLSLLPFKELTKRPNLAKVGMDSVMKKKKMMMMMNNIRAKIVK
jgi:hypothetical protein